MQKKIFLSSKLTNSDFKVEINNIQNKINNLDEHIKYIEYQVKIQKKTTR
jgi:hypothetical protein